MRHLILTTIVALMWALPASAQQRYTLQSFSELTATGATNGINVQGANVPSTHTVQVVVTGSPTGCETQLEGSLDGTVWFDLSGTQTCTSSDMYHVVNRGVTWVRVNLTSLTGGSSPTVNIKYLGQTPGN